MDSGGGGGEVGEVPHVLADDGLAAVGTRWFVSRYSPGIRRSRASGYDRVQAGMGSAPNCPLPRQPIGPGMYNLVVQLGNLRSAKVPFMLAQPAPAPPPAEGAPPPTAVG